MLFLWCSHADGRGPCILARSGACQVRCAATIAGLGHSHWVWVDLHMPIADRAVLLLHTIPLLFTQVEW